MKEKVVETIKEVAKKKVTPVKEERPVLRDRKGNIIEKRKNG